MVRAGAVSHPSEWVQCGYNEIQNPKKRYGIIDISHLMNLLSADSVEGLRVSHYSWVEEKLKQNTNKRDAEWTESIGVGSRSFLRAIKEKLGYRARGRSIIEGNEPSTYQLREPQSVYGAHHHGDMNNLYPWDIYREAFFGEVDLKPPILCPEWSF